MPVERPAHFRRRSGVRARCVGSPRSGTSELGGSARDHARRREAPGVPCSRGSRRRPGESVVPARFLGLSRPLVAPWSTWIPSRPRTALYGRRREVQTIDVSYRLPRHAMFPAFVCNTFGFLLLTTIGVHTPVRTSPHAPSVPVLPCSFGGGAHTLSYEGLRPVPIPGARSRRTGIKRRDRNRVRRHAAVQSILARR